ncbi:aminotransferase class I/II-fold pyridoxal phosphate-dependent enzyme [Saccharophagus degradans]|uniref:aminotransferase class I/II-fold pyridoxal phosphate-dependent enzyme n=1 Tax=Saccharophagus degradans TaxID=86304 RepID=UPI00003C9202|nr:aminotransferase class I/II-fold pyridoxal phosphate-dependent enzyme [Saccharophagus degradans]
MNLSNASVEQLQEWKQQLSAEYDNVLARKLNLDLTRGKPSAEQLSLSDAMDGILAGDYITASGIDVRNYGGLEGIPEARAIGSDILGVPVENVLAGGNSSLTLMYQTMAIAHQFGLAGEGSAWSQEGTVKFLCPVPGYDRHYSVCEHLGIEMLTVAMTSTGPDMDQVEKMIAADPSIKGMWCVPKYSNPTGVVYSDETVERIANLGNIAGKNFRVFWDNAYAIHDLSDNPVALANIFEACKAAGTEDSVIQFASTSKVTHAGSGVAFIAASDTNLKFFKLALGFMTIGPDKVNQLRHAKFFAADGALSAHMAKHAAIIKPRFASVLKHLEAAFSDNDLGEWESADGGYFISFDTRPGLAQKVVKLAGDAGVKLTPAGATFPYGKDPQDSNIRIAPTVPTVDQVEEAMQVFVLCVKLASVEQALANS